MYPIQNILQSIHSIYFSCLKSCGWSNNLYRWSQPICSKLSIRHTTTLSISASTDQSSFSKKFQCWWFNVLWENNDTLAVSPASEEMEAYFAQLNLTKNIQEEEKQKTTCVCLPPNIISCCHWYTTPNMTQTTSGIAQWRCLHLPAHNGNAVFKFLTSTAAKPPRLGTPHVVVAVHVPKVHATD